MAGRNIKGITIEIGGDTTKLQSALKGVDTSLRSTQASLRDVNKLLKMDPGNVTLLGQKQECLTKQIEDTKSKLETEKTALAQLKASNTTGEVTEEQKALERQVIETEQKLGNLKKEYSEFGGVATQKLKIVSSKLKDVGSAVTNAGKTLTTHLTVPIVGAAGASVAAWKEVDEAMDTVTKKTGASGEALAGMQQSAKNIAQTIPTDFQTAADAVGEVNTRFGLTGKALEDLSTKFVQFASLNDTDVSTSVDGVQKVMAAFGVEAKDAGDVLDLLNTVGQNTGLSMDALEGSLVKNATSLQAMGFSLSDSAKFLGDLEVSGADTSKVMTGLKKALQVAAKEGKPMDMALKEVQESIKGAGNDTEATQKAMDLFGKSAGPAIAKAVREGKLSFEDLGTSLSDYSGSVGSTFDETLDPLDKMQTTLNTLKATGADIVETAAPAIQTVMTQLSTIVKDLSDKWNGLTEGQQQTILKAALVVAALGPVITVIGGVISAVSVVTGAISGITGAIGAVGAAGGLIPAIGGIATAAAPFLIGGAVIAGVVAAVVLVVKNWDKIKAKATELGNKVKEAWNTLKTNTANAWNNVKTSVTNAMNNAKTAASNAWNSMKTKVSTTAESIKSTVSNKLTAAKNSIQNAWNTAKEKTGEIWGNIKDKVDENGGGIEGIVKTYAEGIDTAWTKMLGAIDDATGLDLSSMYDTVKGTFDDIWDKVSGVASDLMGVFDFNWSLPDIQLPHFSWEWNDLGHGISLPSISVDWYKKAYDNPYLFTSPTIVGGRGFGDGGGSGEIVYGRDQLMRDIAQAAGGDEITINVYAREGQDLRQLARAISDELALMQRQRDRVYA